MIKPVLLIAGLLGLTSSPAAALSVTAEGAQSNRFGFTSSTPFSVTAEALDFSGTGFQSLLSIDSITATLILFDGDTSPGEFDDGDLFLALDGVNTGLALDGFSNRLLTERTVTLDAPDNAPALLAALQDGFLTPTIVDTDPGDNFLFTPGYFDFVLTLTGTPGASITPVTAPSPAAVGLGLAGVLGLVGRRHRPRQA